MFRLLSSLLLISAAWGQFGEPASDVKKGANLPATCQPGNIFHRTGLTNPGLYDCPAANTWRLVAIGGNFAAKGVYAAGTTYVKLDLVSYNGTSYVSVADANTGHTPDSSPTWWATPGPQGVAGTPGADGSTGPTGPAGIPASIPPYYSSVITNTTATVLGSTHGFITTPCGLAVMVYDNSSPKRQLLAPDGPAADGVHAIDVDPSTCDVVVTFSTTKTFYIAINGGTGPRGNAGATGAQGPAGSGTIDSVTNIIKGDGAGAGVDSGVAIASVVQLNTTNTYGSSAVNNSIAASHTMPVKTGTAASIPATCTVGELYFSSDGILDRKLQNCIATNTWAPIAYTSGTSVPGTCTTGQVYFKTNALAGQNWQYCTATDTWTAQSNPFKSIGVTFDGGGSALSGSVTRCGLVEFAGTIKSATIFADQTGSGTVDVKTVVYGSYTGAASSSSIAASAKPTLSTAIKSQDITLTGWTTALAANTVVCYALTSPATSTWITVVLKILPN